MFDIGPMDMLVLGIVGILVFGPERLPGLARDAARMIRAGREMLIGTHSQLRDEFGPEFAALTDRLGGDLDLRKALAQLLAEEPTPESLTELESDTPPALDLYKPKHGAASDVGAKPLFRSRSAA